MNFQNVTLKFANMRKPQNFTINPYDGSGRAILQSDKAIVRVDVSGKTQCATYNLKGSYFSHLSSALGAITVSDFPKEVIAEIIEKIKEGGNTLNLGEGIVYAEQTLTNLG